MANNDPETTRLLILSTALGQANAGAHYINGSDGHTPGNSDGLTGKRKLHLVEDGKWETLGIHAAVYGSKVCEGRRDKVGGLMFSPDTEKLKNLKEYVEHNTKLGLTPNNWPSFEKGLFPRRTRKVGGTIYLGEDCRGKRHFDCIFFVNWCIKQHLDPTKVKNYQFSIQQYESGTAPVDVFNLGNFPKKVLNADIVTRIKEGKTDHIGLLIAGGKQVVEASGKSRGVIISDFDPTKWTAFCRIKDAYLKDHSA